jgi:hypothetical protein
MYDYLVEFNLERYTINRPKAEQQSTLQAVLKEHQNGYPNSSQNITRRSHSGSRQRVKVKGAVPDP